MKERWMDEKNRVEGETETKRTESERLEIKQGEEEQGEFMGGESVGGCQAFSHRGVTVRWLQ